jgi:hypothetical protein
MDAIDDVTDIFEVNKWIGVGKKYPSSDTPRQVDEARQRTLAIPIEYEAYFSPPNLPVLEFVMRPLPSQSSELITTKPEIWFSKDKPSTAVACLLARPIPPRLFLASLDKTFGQAWFDGAKSIVDQRFNNSTDRLPLWALTFWKMLSEYVEKQAVWKKSILWIEKEKEQAHKRDEGTLKVVEIAQEHLKFLGWNVPLTYQRRMSYSFELASLLSTAWLNDEHINMMMEELDKKITTNPQKIIIAPLAFIGAIQKAT